DPLLPIPDPLRANPHPAGIRRGHPPRGASEVAPTAGAPAPVAVAPVGVRPSASGPDVHVPRADAGGEVPSEIPCAPVMATSAVSATVVATTAEVPAASAVPTTTTASFGVRRAWRKQTNESAHKHDRKYF